MNSVISQLRLHHIADQFIGSPDTGGISGGERRRVTIGIELVTKYLLLLLLLLLLFFLIHSSPLSLSVNMADSLVTAATVRRYCC